MYQRKHDSHPPTVISGVTHTLHLFALRTPKECLSHHHTTSSSSSYSDTKYFFFDDQERREERRYSKKHTREWDARKKAGNKFLNAQSCYFFSLLFILFPHLFSLSLLHIFELLGYSLSSFSHTNTNDRLKSFTYDTFHGRKRDRR
jgi:hypothetical protein